MKEVMKEKNKYRKKNTEEIGQPKREDRIPFEKKILPTGIIILRTYLEIGNALPYRKNCFQELLGSVIPI